MCRYRYDNRIIPRENIPVVGYQRHTLQNKVNETAENSVKFENSTNRPMVSLDKYMYGYVGLSASMRLKKQFGDWWDVSIHYGRAIRSMR